MIHLVPVADTQFAEATWIMIAKSLVIFAVIFAILPILTIVERKLIGRFQHRYGPNRVGPFGLMQPLADVGKLISKESFRPENAISTLFILGPLLPVLSGVLALAILPWGDVKDGVGFYGIDVPIGVLYFFAVGSIAFYGLLLGGWMGPGPGWLDPIWMLIKMLALVFVFIWVRATLPRLRYDQLMTLGWKVLLPLATLNVLVTAILVVVT